MSVHERSRDLVLLPTTLLLFGAISVALGADANYDLLNYHYYNGYAAWTGRLGFDYGAAQVQTFLNPTLDVPVYLLIESLPPIVVGFVLGALHGVNVWLVFKLGLHVLGPSRPHATRLALLFAATAMGAGAISEIGTTYHDLTLAPLVLGCLLLLLRTAREDAGSAGRWCVTAGVLLGLAVGLKYTFAVFVPGAVLAAFLLAPRGWRRRLVLTSGCVAGIAVGVAIAAGPWMLYLWNAYGNPLGPFYNGVFQSPYFQPTNFADRRFLPKTTLQVVAYPFYFFLSRKRVVTEASGFREARFAVAYVLVLAVMARALLDVYAARRPSAARRVGAMRLSRADLALLVFAVVSYVVWQRQFSIYRYVIPLELLVPVLIYVLLSRLVASERRRILLLVMLLAGVIVCTRSARYGRVDWHPELFGTRVDAASVPPTSLLLIASREPVAFVIPAMPPSVRAVRIQSNIFRPELRTRLSDEIRAVVAAHQGPIRLLSHARGRGEAERAVAAYGLRVVERTCQQVPNHMDPGVELCVVGR